MKLIQIILSFFIFYCPVFSQKPILEDNLYLKGIAKNKTAIYKSASSKSSKVTRLEAFDIVYIYKKPGSSGYYRVGPTPDGMTGYVPADDIREWNNRLCLHFTSLKGRQPALVFDSPEPLAECLRGTEDFYDTNGKPHKNSIAMEPDEEKLAGQRFSMLLPILDRRREKLGTGPHLTYEIGFLMGGDVSYASSDVSSKKRSSKTAELELMFLIDVTGSMQPYIDGTKEIIKNVTRRILSSREGGCRFGVTAYRDYRDDFVYQQFANLNRNSTHVINSLSSISAAGGHDAPEAVFDGFLGALTETSWHETQNTLRLIILIGDASAHPPGSVGNPRNISPRQLLEKASEIKVRALAVKIGGSSGDEGASQFTELAEGLTEADKGTYISVEYKGSMDSEFIEKTSAKIEAEIHRLEKMIKVIIDSEDSYSSEPIFPSGTSSTDRAIILKNIKIEPGSPRPIEFSTGWINEYDKGGAKVANSYVYMTRDEFKLMINYIKLAGDVVTDPDKALGGTVKEVIEVSTGESLKGTDLEAHYKKALNLPVKTDILRIPVKELESWGEDRKSRMLKLIKGKYNQLEIWGNNLENWYEAPGGGGFKYTFVPVDMLP